MTYQNTDTGDINFYLQFVSQDVCICDLLSLAFSTSIRLYNGKLQTVPGPYRHELLYHLSHYFQEHRIMWKTLVVRYFCVICLTFLFLLFQYAAVPLLHTAPLHPFSHTLYLICSAAGILLLCLINIITASEFPLFTNTLMSWKTRALS